MSSKDDYCFARINQFYLDDEEMYLLRRYPEYTYKEMAADLRLNNHTAIWGKLIKAVLKIEKYYNQMWENSYYGPCADFLEWMKQERIIKWYDPGTNCFFGPTALKQKHTAEKNRKMRIAS